MSRWKIFLLALLLGLVAGLVYGWLVSPVEFVNTTTEILSADFRTDMVLMTAEMYSSSTDLETVSHALELLFNQPPATISAEALDFALASGYAQPDIILLQKLSNALDLSRSGVSP
jgi:hypothetical protein